MRLKRIALGIGLLMLFLFQAGCAVHKLTAHWCNYNIAANGCDNEWQEIPQYYDEGRQIAVRMANHAEALFLCISISDNALKKQNGLGRLTIWLDPQGGKAKTFGIHLSSGDPKGPTLGSRSETGVMRPTDDRGSSMGNQPKLPSVVPLKKLEITYKDTTGPLKMTMDEVHLTGIEIGVGQSKEGRLIYEFDIGFQAAPCLSGLEPGMDIGVGIQINTPEKESRKRAPTNGQMGRGGPGGGMSGPGPGGSAGGRVFSHASEGLHLGEENDPFEVWLQVQLANRASG
ncbi:hypothetical protein [uncultured Desulfosarcina sp.]|uniref:hypothetical protein n=1 Tax=uncultured Desulfosarcina sp. TaxID=218289 RepID=UPI0029C7097D|nr:hypothetical protein [uncultured Desulfosarcina sp.]